MTKITYFTTVRVWLHLEDFYNQGLRPERVKEIIEGMRDDFGNGNYFHCEQMGINQNWIIQTCCHDPRDIRLIVSLIEMALMGELQKCKMETKPEQTHS